MILDQPTIVYHKEDKSDSHSKKEMDSLFDKWKAKHKSLSGEKISLSDYLNNNNALK